MIEAKHYKDYKHNYMILQCAQENTGRSYQQQMLTSGRIKELLTCSIRYLNGQTYFYYDISSKTTLENYYQGKKMSYGQVRDLFWQLHTIYNSLGAFFMEETKLVLSPETIYYDITDQKYMGLYYPDYEPESDHPYEALMDYLLDHIDTEDQQLADCMYRIYELAEGACFSMEDGLRLLDQREGCEREEVAAAAEPDLFHIEQNAESAPAAESENLFCAYEQEEMPANRKRNLFYPIFAVLSVVGMAAVIAVYYLYELSAEEMLTLTGCAAAMGVCFLICLALMIRDRGKESAGKKQRHEPLSSKERDEMYETEKPPISLEHVLSRDMNLYMAEQKPDHNRGEDFYENVSGKNAECGNTVFFDPSDMTEYKLYALDKKNKKHIELKQFPCTIGKMAGCVDHVLTDDSVSRIHAKLDKQDDRILLTDMNSTNGTYKNGLRMQPQETTVIEPGDEIRFGSLNYCYR